MNNTILEYLEGYFGGELNESTSDEDIMEAFNELLETADAVEEFMIQEGPMSMLKNMGTAIRKRIQRKMRMPGVIRKRRARRVADRKQTSSNILGVRSAAETLGLAKGDLAKSD